VNKNKYLIGLIGLAVGFIASFFLTQNYNRSNAAQSASVGTSGMAGGGAGGQQAMMGQVAGVIEKAKNAPNDFQAQVEAAKIFNQVGRVAETVDYLKKAYAIDPTKFNELGAGGFLGQYYFEQKDYAEAETWFNRAIGAEETVKRLKEVDPTNKRIPSLETLVADLKAGRAVTIPKE
jgi:tetratricopeptide (TPR) repeat protein